MKKLILAALALVLSVPSFAQFASGGFELDRNNLYYGARMGMTFGWMTGEGIDASGAVTGLNLGGVIGLRVSGTVPVFLESGLYYTQRGGKEGDYKMKLKYLELPILIKYGIQLNDEFAVLPFIGPYFSYGIGGKSSVKGSEERHSSFNDVKHGDMGLKLGAGLEYNMLYVEAGLQFGIADISQSNHTVHGNMFFANFGINF